MSVTLFISLLTIFSIITGLCTEAFKKIFDEMKMSYASNIIAFIIATVVGAGGMAIYYIINSISFDLTNIVTMVLMGITTAISATVGYDKVIQTIKQIEINCK